VARILTFGSLKISNQPSPITDFQNDDAFSTIEYRGVQNDVENW
jgi:hypothetical protein